MWRIDGVDEVRVKKDEVQSKERHSGDAVSRLPSDTRATCCGAADVRSLRRTVFPCCYIYPESPRQHPQKLDAEI